MKTLLILIQRFKYKLNLDRKNYILKYIRKNKPKTILEIGVFNGVFARRMLLNATNSINEIVSYTGVDLFEDLSIEIYKKEISLWASNQDSVHNNLSKIKNTKINLLKGYSRDVLPLLEGKIKFDLILIDGGHSYETVKTDFYFARNLVSSNGAIFFDDYVNYVTRTQKSGQNKIKLSISVVKTFLKKIEISCDLNLPPNFSVSEFLM
jgi:predicted O-methyltransferase YrrM